MSAAARICGACAGILALALATPDLAPAGGRQVAHPATRAHLAHAGVHRRAHRRSASEALSGGATPASVLAPTPYMGWDSYFAFGSHYDEPTILEQASQMVRRGLVRNGYDYLWLDVGWWQGTRGAAGEITVNPTQWPHGMAWLTGVLHAAGLRVGLYTDAGANGCGGQGQGGYGHYQQDVNTFAAWGFDAVKVDFCGGIQQRLEPAATYGAFHEAIVHNSSGRPMLLSVCNFLQPGQYESEVPTFAGSGFASYTFGPSVANSWRTDTDVGVPGDVEFVSVLRNLDADAAQPEAAGPGHWNDPDYLGPDQGMGPEQFRTQFSMWAMLAAPLMVSEDLVSMSSATATTVSNREAIAIDQDPAGVQGRLLATSGSAGEVWVKPLSDGATAVALLNRSGRSIQIATSAAAVGMPAASAYHVRNVWTGALTSTTGAIAANVPANGTALLRISTAARALPASPRRRG